MKLSQGNASRLFLKKETNLHRHTIIAIISVYVYIIVWRWIFTKTKYQDSWYGFLEQCDLVVLFEYQNDFTRKSLSRKQSSEQSSIILNRSTVFACSLRGIILSLRFLVEFIFIFANEAIVFYRVIIKCITSRFRII